MYFCIFFSTKNSCRISKKRLTGCFHCGNIPIVAAIKKQQILREWLSGGASPCQGEGRGFDSRLALFSCLKQNSNHLWKKETELPAGHRLFLYAIFQPTRLSFARLFLLWNIPHGKHSRSTYRSFRSFSSCKCFGLPEIRQSGWL